MRARDVMVSPVITVKPSAFVRDVAKLLLEHRISAVPVVDDQERLVGIVSEGDLIHRSEIGTEQRRSWWLFLIANQQSIAVDYIKAHATKIGDIMSRNVVTAVPDTSLHEIAMMMERNAIKRIPIVRDGQIVGIVSRANLVQAIASAGTKLEIPLSDTNIRDKLMTNLKSQNWAHTALLNVTVTDGVVDLWGLSNSETERKALRVAAETTPGVRAVNDHLIVRRLESFQ
jgi:CBS-domain-containing membrane protein